MYTERQETCGKRIAKALALKGMKQTDLCKLTNIPKGSMSLYLKDAYEPKQDRIFLMAQVLGVSEAWLMGYDVPMIKKENTLDKQTLTESEKELLDLFRRVPEESRQMVIQMIQIALKK
jgi:transcriptional regulator with XRE-family HTH domain